MAKYIGTLTSDARGKVGGLVLTRARNGTNIRAMAVPVNPATVRQVYTRGIIGAALSAYRQLTAPQQGSWSLFAALYTWTNSLAQPFTPTGLQLWTQAYVNAARFGTMPRVAWCRTGRRLVPLPHPFDPWPLLPVHRLRQRQRPSVSQLRAPPRAPLHHGGGRRLLHEHRPWLVRRLRQHAPLRPLDRGLHHVG